MNGLETIVRHWRCPDCDSGEFSVRHTEHNIFTDDCDKKGIASRHVEQSTGAILRVDCAWCSYMEDGIAALHRAKGDDPRVAT